MLVGESVSKFESRTPRTGKTRLITLRLSRHALICVTVLLYICV